MFTPTLLTSFLVAATFAVQDSTPKPAPPPRTLAELEARIQQVLDSGKVPGVGLAIVRHDSVIYAAGIGRARVSPELKATDMTLFRIGSTSKAFVALTAQALVREGKLRLDQPLAEALPGFVFTNPWESTDPVRIVHLLEHTSGFDDNSLQSYANNDPTPLTLAQGLAIDVATRKSRWRPGTRFSYCNTGPAIVALLIERIEGKPFEQVVQERWFTPIGMRTATYFHPDTTTQSVATLYKADGTTAVPYWHVFIRPAGSINANAHDMAAYVRFLLGRGTIDGKTLLPAEAIDRMEHSGSSLGSRSGLAVGYGLHLYRVADTTGFAWTGHNGGVDGGLSDLSYMPEYGVGYAFQINSGNGEAFGKITSLVRAFLTQGLTPPGAPAVATLASSTATDFGGWYRAVSPRTQHLYPMERIFNIAHVSFTDSTMNMSEVFGDAKAFVPVDSLRFRRAAQPEATLAFVHDAANDRPEGIESMGAGLGTSMARVSAIDALGSYAAALLWFAGLALAVVAMVFGALRWVVRRARKRPTAASVTALPWRIAASASVVLAVHFGMLIKGSDDVRALGGFTGTSVTVYVAGLLFALLALYGAFVTWRTRGAQGKWQAVSLWTVRGVATLNLVAACYLTLSGWIGWRTWV